MVKLLAFCLCAAMAGMCFAVEAATGTVAGLVEGIDAEGFEGATISLTEDSLYSRIDPKPAAEAVTNAEGRYSVSLPPGKYVFQLHDDGKYLGEVKTDIEVKAGETTRVDSAFMKGVNTIGTCQLDDQPVEGVKVTAICNGWPGSTATTNAEGAYAIRVRPPKACLRFEYPPIEKGGIKIAPVVGAAPFTPVFGQQPLVNTNVDSAAFAELDLKGIDEAKLAAGTRVALQDKYNTMLLKTTGTAMKGELLKGKGPWDTLVWLGVVPGEYTVHVVSGPLSARSRKCVLEAGKNEVTLDAPK